MPQWPDIPYEPWRETCDALHLYAQIVGKYRLARTPWVNHSWHATFYVAARGITSGPIPDEGGSIEAMFDLIAHRLILATSYGRTSSLALEPMSVASFHERFLKALRAIGGSAKISRIPNEIPAALPFDEDVAERPYDGDAVARYFHALAAVDAVMKRFRTGFLGKVSPVHLFWGSFDLAVTRFSGRPAPPHPGGIEGLPDRVTREAYSHEVSSAGFWPGGMGIDYPAFYSYAYPGPDGFSEAHVEPSDAFFSSDMGEFILPYEAVRLSGEPEATLLRFLESSYVAAAELGHWDRAALECPIGRPLRPRPVPSIP